MSNPLAAVALKPSFRLRDGLPFLFAFVATPSWSYRFTSNAAAGQMVLAYNVLWDGSEYWSSIDHAVVRPRDGQYVFQPIAVNVRHGNQFYWALGVGG